MDDYTINITVFKSTFLWLDLLLLAIFMAVRLVRWILDILP